MIPEPIYTTNDKDDIYNNLTHKTSIKLYYMILLHC